MGRTNSQREYRSILSNGHLSQEALPDGSAPNGSLHLFPWHLSPLDIMLVYSFAPPATVTVHRADTCSVRELRPPGLRFCDIQIKHKTQSAKQKRAVLSLVAQSCLTLCNLMDYSPPGFSVYGILQARILEGLPCPPPGDLHNPGIELGSPALQVDSLLSEPPGKPRNTNYRGCV